MIHGSLRFISFIQFFYVSEMLKKIIFQVGRFALSRAVSSQVYQQ